MKQLAVTARVLAWAAVALLFAALLWAPGGPLGPGLARAAEALVLSGDVEGLTPGQSAPLRLTVGNPTDQQVVVHAVTTAVSGGGPGCDAGRLVVPAWSGTLAVPAHGSADVELIASLAAGAACEGREWHLEYAAS
jgi:hypothetical protein